VMTSSNLLAIIEKYNLYADERQRMTRDEMVARMRENVQREMISAEVVDPRAGRSTKATIAFAVGFESRSPELAARVANDIVTLYLQKNIETRKQLAAGTTEFLADEAEKLRVRIAEIEQRIAQFKELNYQRLPEFSQANAQLLATTSADARELDSRIQALNQQISYLDAQLAQIEPHMPVTESGERFLGAAERLRGLREQYLRQLTLFTPKHPAMVDLRNEIRNLEQQVGGGAAATAVLDRLDQVHTDLAQARLRQPPDEAEVKRLEQLVGGLSAEFKALPIRMDRGGGASDTPDNPAYVSIQAQRENAATERAMLMTRRDDLARQLGDLQRRQLETPAVERDFNALQRELESEQTKYADVRQKLLEAQLAQNLETEQKGERFTLIEPPLQPQEPVKPNRPAILALGVLAALGSAIGLMVLLELLDTRVRGRRQVVDLVGAPPLAIIPWVAADEKPRWLRWPWRRRAVANLAGA